MKYQQIITNEECTANLKVEPFGWNKGALVSWNKIEPLPGALGNSKYKIIDYDENPLIAGKVSLMCDGKTIFYEDYETDHKHIYWLSDQVVKQCETQVSYGDSKLFTLSIENLRFRYITGRWTNGGDKTIENITLDVFDQFAFRQKEETDSYGSESTKYLFWPWQNTR